MSFASKFNRNSSYRLFTGSMGGKSYWHWVKLDPVKLVMVGKLIQKGSLDIKDYGTIVKSGYGNPPPVDTL